MEFKLHEEVFYFKLNEKYKIIATATEPLKLPLSKTLFPKEGCDYIIGQDRDKSHTGMGVYFHITKLQISKI